MATLLSPFALLQEINARAQRTAAGLPQQSQKRHDWLGIGFRTGDTFLVAPVHEITEILPFSQQIASVPGARAWVRGVANIGGTLLPIIDLGAYLGQPPAPQQPQNRILIIQQDELQAGLLVTEVLGLKRFPPAALRPGTPDDLRAPLSSYTTAAVFEGETRWLVFNPRLLGQDQNFMDVAA